MLSMFVNVINYIETKLIKFNILLNANLKYRILRYSNIKIDFIKASWLDTINSINYIIVNI